MTTKDKEIKLRQFSNEKEFRLFLIDLLKKMGYKDVWHTHKYGAPELGKDIIAKFSHKIEGDEWYAFVVKHGRIGGGSTELETIKNQIKQSFEYPYEGINGEKLKINKVKVITNENFTTGAQNSIISSPELSRYGNFKFLWNESLIQDIDEYYPDFWLPGDAFTKEYSKESKRKILEEFELKDLSIRRIEDKKIKKLLDIFIDPIITENIKEDASIEGKVTERMTTKKISLTNLCESTDNIIITGEAGSGKTKILNNIACQILDSQKNAEEKILPVKVKAKLLKENGFDILKSINIVIKENAPDSYEKIDLTEYQKILFVDEIDSLNHSEKLDLINSLSEFASDKNRFILSQRKNDNLNLKVPGENLKTVKVQNFNIKQIESFIDKFFEGNDRGQKFIQIIKESNLFSKLPTTPLTITLLSLLYDDNGYEIPATLTDIYEDFVQILFGKLEIRNRNDLLIFNIKKRLFSFIALKMLDERSFEIKLDAFCDELNAFLKKKGYQQQTREDFIEIINNSGVLFIDHMEMVGFKQQAFIEYLSSVEIYDHARSTHYEYMLQNFNDVVWQNTSIFFAGRSKDSPEMIHDLMRIIPNATLRDWFINVGGIGYLSQALYLTDVSERKKLILLSLENMVKSFYHIQELTQQDVPVFKNWPLPLIAMLLSDWFIENFKSITLKETLNEIFDELAIEYKNADINDFKGDFKLFLIASTLMHKNINDINAFQKLMDRDSFIKNPVLMISGDFLLMRYANADKKHIVDDIKKRMEKQIKKYINALRYIIKEPGYRFDKNYKYLPKQKQLEDKSPIS